MNSQLAQKLENMLREACPYASGQLESSIQMLQLNANEWIILIGNESGSINGTPSEQYAHITNDYPLIGWSKKEQKFTTPNRNYHWVNKTIKKWADENMLQFQLEGDEYE